MRRCIAAALLLLLVACGDDGGDSGAPAGTPTCADVYAEGASTDEIVEYNDEDLEDAGCITSEGEWEVQALAYFDCEDGERVVYYNQFGWGISGGPWHHYTAADQDGAPAPDADVC